jgi:hypothetical protein
MAIEITFKGTEEIQRRLTEYAHRIPNICGEALREEAEIEKTESMQRTPVDTGALRSSHTVSAPIFRGREVSVIIGVGGPSAPYAVIVHEDEDAFHAVGEAKFLQSTILESKPFMARRLANRIREKLR